jgi:FkbM family methyltransferase
MVKDFQHVYCFEPLESRYKYLPINCKMNNVTLYGCCLGNKTEKVNMYGGCIYNSELEGIEERLENEKKITLQPSIRLDDLNLNDVDFIKIDVEGYELPVLEGAVETLKRCKPVVCLEQNGSEEQWRGAKRNEAMDFLKTLGMKMEKQLNYQDYLFIWE